MNKNKVKDWSSKKLQDYVDSEITFMFEGILDFSQLAVSDDKRYKVLRSKILKLANNAARSIKAEIENSYDVEYTKINHDIVKVSNFKG